MTVVYSTDCFELGSVIISGFGELLYLDLDGERYYKCSSICNSIEKMNNGIIIGNYLRYFIDDTIPGQCSKFRFSPQEIIDFDNSFNNHNAKVQIIIDENWFNLKDAINYELYDFCGTYIGSFLLLDFASWVKHRIFTKLPESFECCED